MIFDNHHDAVMRLHNSVVRYKKRPVVVYNIADEPGLPKYKLLGLVDGKWDSVMADDPDFDVSPVPTGYLNYMDTCGYLSRVPIRKWKQGLHRDNSIILWPDEERGHPDIGGLLMESCTGDMVLGNYPNFEQALVAVRERDVRARAWHASWCIWGNKEVGIPYLLYKGQTVGMVVEGRCHLGDRYKWLIEELTIARGEAV